MTSTNMRLEPRMGMAQAIRTSSMAMSTSTCSQLASRHCTPRLPLRRQPLVIEANAEKSNTTTKRRLSGPPGLPPINANDGGGGGGGWDGGKIVRNIALNAMFLGIYFLIDSGGGGGGFFGGGGGGGGGGSNFSNSGQPQMTMRELPTDDYDEDRKKSSNKKKYARKGQRRVVTA